MALDAFEVDFGAGRETSFRQIFERFHRPVYRFFERRGFSTGECEDLTQEAFVRIHKGLEGLREIAGLKAWIFEISANVYRQELRRRSALKRSGHEVSWPAGKEDRGEAPVSASEPGPLRRTLARERVELLEAALEDLSPQMRRCVLLRGYQELSYEEIAAALQVSVQTVKVHLHRARQKLNAKLGDFDF